MLGRTRGAPGVVVVVAVVLLLTSCSSAPSADVGTVLPDREVTVAFQFPPRSAYALDSDEGARLARFGVVETLVALDEDAQPVPQLATAWEQQVDLRTWRFQLRPGVVFHDGNVLDSAAVVTALGYISSVAAPPRAINGIGLKVAADGADAVLISTTEPDPILPLRLSSGATGILSPVAYAGGGQPAIIRTGTGPLQLTEVNGVQSATLLRFDGYWGEKAAAETINVRYLPDPPARALAIRAGDVNLTEGLPEASLAELSATEGVTVESYPAARTIELLLNQSAPPFSDIRVRQAVTAAIDRPALAQQVLNGAALPAAELFGPAVPWGSTKPPAGANVAEARRLLADAGYGPDNPLSVRLWTFPNRPELPLLATAVQAMLAQAGIQARIEIGDYAAQEPQVLAGRFDMFISSRSYLSDFPDPTGVLTSDYSCAGSYNIDHYCSAEFDALLATLPGISDPGQRQQVFREAAQKLVADAVGVPLVHARNTVALRGVTGFVADPLDLRPVLPELAQVG
jgi:peptide/nickel transport system substrate-binding protein